jgi:hypothetical protein
MKNGAPEERPRFLKEFLKWAAKLDDLCSGDRLVLCALFGYLGKNNSCWPTQSMLAEDTGLCTKQVKRILGKLASKKIIRCTKRKRGKNTNEYQFVFAQSDQTKGDIDVPSKGNIDVPSKGDTGVPSKGTRVSPTKGTSRVRKNQEKQASSMQDGSLNISKYIRNKSVNQSGENDGLMTNTEEKTLREKPASGEVDPLVWNEEDVLPMKPENENFVPPPGAPSRLSPEQVKAIFRGPGPRPVDILDCPEGEFDLSRLVAPLKGLPEVFEIIRFNPGISQVEWFEKALKEFYRKVIDRHWSKKATPPGIPFRRLFFKAGRSGLLYDFGFRPLSPEQQEERRREQERQEAQEREDARLREEERRRHAEKDAALRKFISLPTVRDYLDFMGIPRKLGIIRDHLREITARPNGPATADMIEQFMREELRKEGY